MTSRRSPSGSDSLRGDSGQGAIVLVVALLVVAAAVGLLGRTTMLAADIDEKSESIANAGQGINTSTAAIIKLDKTNEYGASILATAQPLEEKLGKVVQIANSIDDTATSINATAGAIETSARGINGTAASILEVAQSIKRGVVQINSNVDVTIRLVNQIRSDTSNIVTQAGNAMKSAACIDKGLSYGGANSGGQDDGHCR